jgi:FtsP/CotA-like multicopper oxidase with cupredoxin domain
MLKLGLLGTGAVMLPVGAIVRSVAAADSNTVDSPPFEPFARPLRIPAVIQPDPALSTADTDHFVVTQMVAQQEILPGLKTTVWTYNGTFPGPTFKVRRGRRALVTQRNRLAVPTTTHLHGGDVPAASDGHPLNLHNPGEDFTHDYPNIQPAATLWYHDHAIHETGRNVWMGLAGFYLLTDDHEESLPLPKDPFDIGLVIQDRAFNPDGSLFLPRHDPQRPARQGAFGDVILVNGVPKPFLRVARRKYRFRILNGSNARFYNLELSSGDPMTVIATEGGLLPHPVQTPDLFITEAERYNVIIDFSRYPVGTQVILKNTIAPDPFGDPVDPDKVRDIMRFDVVEDATDTSSIPTDLAPPLDVHPEDALRTRTWRFNRSGGQWVINGLPFGDTRRDAFPAFGSTEIWEFVNNSGGWLHPIHPHLVRYLILDRNGEPPRPYERGPKETVSLGANETVRVVMKFVDFRGLYAFHCHNIEHEDDDMMTQFEVV